PYFHRRRKRQGMRLANDGPQLQPPRQRQAKEDAEAGQPDQQQRQNKIGAVRRSQGLRRRGEFLRHRRQHPQRGRQRRRHQPRQSLPQEYQGGERHQEFERGGKPQPETDTGGVGAERQGQKADGQGKQAGLPQMVQQCRHASFFRLAESSLSSRSASATSLAV